MPLSTAFEEGASREVAADPLVEWYRMLRGYKRTDADFDAYHEALVGLIGVGLHYHVDRIEELLGGAANRVCVVPSSNDEFRTSEKALDQPLYRAVRRIRLPRAMHLSAPLEHSGVKRRHAVDASTFTCIDGAVRGERIILVEDAIVTGASAMSARACLLEAGVQSVVVVAAARIVQPTFVQSERIDADAYLVAARAPHDFERWVRG